MSEKAMWLRFFRDAGIPGGFDTKYALVFDENRMKMDMLNDLNKECLRDMGINAMGDIIAIIKHAKYVVEESKTQAYEVPKPTSTSPGMNKAPAKAAAASSTSAVVPPKSMVVSTKAAAAGVTGTITAKAPAPTKKVIVTKRLVQRSAITGTKPKPRPDCDSTDEVRIIKKPTTVIRLKGSPERLEVPLQKKTRVLPGQEGSYKITMPQGTTPKTQALLQSRLGPPGKTSVFDRLSRVSSSSESSQEPSPNKSSVFSRLGKGSEKSSAAPLTQDKKDSNFSLSTQFVVKQRPVTSSPSRGSALGGAGKEKVTLNSRLNFVSSPTTASVISKPVTAASSKLSMDGGGNASVKSRLGLRKLQSSSRSRSPLPRRNRSISPPPRRTLVASRIAPPRRSRSRSPLSPKREIRAPRPSVPVGGRLAAERRAIVSKYSKATIR